MANKIQRTYKLDDIIEHVIYEKNVSEVSALASAVLTL